MSDLYQLIKFECISFMAVSWWGLQGKGLSLNRTSVGRSWRVFIVVKVGLKSTSVALSLKMSPSSHRQHANMVWSFTVKHPVVVWEIPTKMSVVSWWRNAGGVNCGLDAGEHQTTEEKKIARLHTIGSFSKVVLIQPCSFRWVVDRLAAFHLCNEDFKQSLS